MTSPSDHDFWDRRFGASEYVYGTEPNDFLFANANLIPPGRVLCLAEGEGRNAVFLARQGHPVTAVDWSREGQRKAALLAARHEVFLGYVIADLADFDPEERAFTGVTSIFCHVVPRVRREMYRRAARALLPGGVMIVEAYSPAQLAFSTGGPKDPALLVSADQLSAELTAAGLEIVIAHERERDVHEGSMHGGRSAVTQAIARCPRSGLRTDDDRMIGGTTRSG
jgi:SAM-dependent methyltransferase